ncbi:MAG TPA: BTAD domain-containing putative transcriptional regulator, partial [Longimicrobium sp.]|nr:BTAD domain-containing putative transcriptional regulator [Longimicrobium sp.]
MIVFNVLGDPVLRRDGAPVTGRAAYRRRLALLAILAAARGRPVGRERLIGLLWPEHAADAARHTLSESLYILRKELGEQTFVSLGDEVALNPEVVGSDLDAFEQALAEGRREEAVALYGGPFLDGFYVADAPDFERWAEGERDRLARALARALEELADADEAAGRPLRAADWWRQLAVRDPFSSRVVLRLGQALRAAGEHTAALRHAEAHAALLREELGVGPDPELAAFVERLRAETRPLPPRPVPAHSAPSAILQRAPEIVASAGGAVNSVDSAAGEAALADSTASPSPGDPSAPEAVDVDAPSSLAGVDELAGAHVASTPVLAPHAPVAASGPPVPSPATFAAAAPGSGSAP